MLNGRVAVVTGGLTGQGFAIASALAAAIKALSGIAQRVIQLFVNHIHKENYVLFPLVQQFLTKEELREIAREML